MGALFVLDVLLAIPLLAWAAARTRAAWWLFAAGTAFAYVHLVLFAWQGPADLVGAALPVAVWAGAWGWWGRRRQKRKLATMKPVPGPAPAVTATSGR